MSLRHASLCTVLTVAFLLTRPGVVGAQPTNDVLEASFWKRQALQTVLPAWTQRARSADSGILFAEIDRDWTPRDTSTQYPGMLARHVFSYSAAYLLSGDDAHLDRASDALDFMIKHGWDEKHGGWYNAVNRNGAVIDEGKDLFMQIYATTGLALYYIATHDQRAETYLNRSRRFMRKNAWDETHGGYVRSLTRTGVVQNAYKDFSPQLAPVSGYLLYLYPATRDTTYLREAERIMDLTLTRMQDDRGWILERFDRDWTFRPDDSKNSHINVGHNLEVAWLLLRLHALTDNERYRRQGLELTDQLLKVAFHDSSGAWRADLDRTEPRRSTSRTTTWWTQAYGNMLQLYAYRLTGSDRYLDAFRRGARFWNEAFVDEEYGGTVLRAAFDGTVVDGDKAVRTKTSYHSMEHALLNYLYLGLWHNEGSVRLHYRMDASEKDRFYPLPIEALRPTIERVTVNGAPQSSPATDDGSVPLPQEGPSQVSVEMSLPSSARP